jgi:hypothetical protein
MPTVYHPRYPANPPGMARQSDTVENIGSVKGRGRFAARFN